MEFHDNGITYMPFTDDQFSALDEAARQRKEYSITAKLRDINNRQVKFTVGICSFRNPEECQDEDEDWSYYVELWEDESLYVDIQVDGYDKGGNLWGHGTGEKLADLIKLGAKAFIAQVFDLTMEGKPTKRRKRKESNKMKGTLTYIEISRLHPHPDNPRKDLGDLTELADSIKAKGVMQNLTVVKGHYLTVEEYIAMCKAEGVTKEVAKNMYSRENAYVDDGYTVIIGHRRMGASKLAGLKELPCVIVEMSAKDQVATMLLENMQRTDLTVYEQAQGFQLMMDLGESVESISEKTGLSKTTVRNRVKLAKYDEKIMRDAAVRQPTMEQYMKLCQIEDIEVANDVARFLGTKNFDHEVEKALRVAKEKKERDEIRALLPTFATKLEDTSYETIKSMNLVSIVSVYSPLTADNRRKIEDLAGSDEELYWGEGYGFTVYRRCSAEDDAALEEAKEKRRKIDELENRAAALYEALEERAREFVKGYNRKDGERYLNEALVEALIWGYIGHGNVYYGIARSLGWQPPEDLRSWDDEYKEEAQEYIERELDKNRCRVILHSIWSVVSHGAIAHLSYNCNKLEPYVNHHWMFILALLSDLGYNVSDEEWAFVNGSHPIYSEEVER